MTKVFITSVPTEFIDLVQIYAENDSQGGGKLKSFVQDEQRQCVTINFVNETDAQRFVEKKSLTILSHEMPITKAPGDATIFVYDVPISFKEDLDCILESPRKGGGPILDINFTDELNCAEVTFEDNKVARYFAEQGTLKMGNKTLSISFLPPSIYRPKYRFHLSPEIIKREPFDATSKSNPPSQRGSFSHESGNSILPGPPNSGRCSNKGEAEFDNKEVIKLRAFNLPEVLDDVNLKKILENKKFGGDTLQSFQFFEKEGHAIFSYARDEVAQAMLKQHVVVLGENLSFNVLRDDEAPHKKEAQTRMDGMCKKSCTVGFKTEVNVSTEAICLYAESRRSNGGPIVNLKEINQSTFLLTFEVAEDAESFSSKDHSAYLKGRAILLESWPKHVKPCAIYVKGFNNVKMSSEMLKMYFENQRSGGRPDSVEQVIVKGGMACIVFKDPTVVDNILAKETLTLGEAKLKVSICEPTFPPPLFGPDVSIDPYWLRFTGIKVPSLNHKEFKEYASSAARSPIVSVSFDKERDKALVKFSGIPDYEHVLETLCSRPFSGVMISVERVPTTDSILVTDYGTFSADMLKLYFENPRSDGGRIKDVKQCPESNAYIIQFEDPSAGNRVVRKMHKIGNITPTVKPYSDGGFSFFATN